MRRVQIEIELKNVYPRLAQKAELPLLGVLLHQRSNLLLAHTAFLSHTRYLKLG